MRAILAAVVLLTAAPAAQARSFSVPAPQVVPTIPGVVDTVALAGDQVLWVEQRGSAAALVAATPNGGRRDVVVLPPVRAKGPTLRHYALTADGGFALLQRFVCARVNSYCARAVAQESLGVDLTTGSATPFDPCPSEFGITVYALRANLLTCRDGVLVDLTDGASYKLGTQLAAAAGPYAVTVGQDHLRVIDWRSGALVRRIREVYLDPLSDDVGLGEDGTIAWTTDHGVQVLRPGDRRPRRAGPVSDFITQVWIAGGRLATRRLQPDRSRRVRVSAFDGSGERSVDGQGGRSADSPRDDFGWAFDGARVAWVAQPCAVPTIQVWDLAENPPPPVSEACGATALPTGRLAFGTGRRTLRVPLTCPPEPVEGCAGDISAHFTVRGRPAGDAYVRAFTIPAGTARTAVLKVVPGSRVRGKTGLTATISLHDRTRYAEWRFRMQG